MPVDQPKDGASLDPGNGKPAIESEDRAVAGSAERNAALTPRPLLVGLGAPEGDYDPLPHALDVVAVEADDFRSPEPAREAEKKQRPVT